MRSTLENKTVRPGLLTYSFYRSDQQPFSRRPAAQPAKSSHRHGHAVVGLVLLMVAGFGLFAGYRTYQAHQQQKPTSPAAVAQAAAVAAGPQECAGNSEDRLIVVIIQKRHLWACQKQAVRYNAPVVTGMEFIPSDKTPRGTYHIYAKQTGTVLTGTDSTGSWRDPVYYWMPFLDNQNGTFGFHDATWRPASDFGNIDPNTPKASHGCVNLSLATAKWLYNWAPVGTTVTVKD
jgi:lipoprotein-anchoring transpeptidase ErfK/SrfK